MFGGWPAGTSHFSHPGCVLVVYASTYRYSNVIEIWHANPVNQPYGSWEAYEDEVDVTIWLKHELVPAPMKVLEDIVIWPNLKCYIVHQEN